MAQNPISLCLQLHQNMIGEFKSLFSSFKRCWDKQRQVFIKISESHINIYSNSQSELLSENEILFQVDTKRVIENMIINVQNEDESITIQIIDFDALVTMINNIDNNAEDVRFYLEEQQEQIYFGVNIQKINNSYLFKSEVIRQDDTKLQRLFECKIIESRIMHIFVPSMMLPVKSQSLAQMFHFAYKLDCSLRVTFIELEKDQFGLRIELLSEQLPSIMFEVVPFGFTKEVCYGKPNHKIEVNKRLCNNCYDICTLEDIIMVGSFNDQLILSYSKQGTIKQFIVPQIIDFQQHQQLEKVEGLKFGQ